MNSNYPIFVLTLEGDDQRRAPLLKRLDQLGLHYNLHFGIDGRRGLPKKCESLIDREATLEIVGREMSDGEYACALSHRQIYQRIITDNLEGAIIIEDDAILTDGFATFVSSKDYNQAPMILIDYAYGRALPFSSRKLTSGTMWRCAKQATVTSGYCVSKETAKSLLAATTPVRCLADWPASLFHMSARLMVPRLINHVAPNADQRSHLAKDRDQLVSRFTSPKVEGTFGINAKIRNRISLRVGRAKGER